MITTERNHRIRYNENPKTSMFVRYSNRLYSVYSDMTWVGDPDYCWGGVWCNGNNKPADRLVYCHVLTAAGDVTLHYYYSLPTFYMCYSTLFHLLHSLSHRVSNRNPFIISFHIVHCSTAVPIIVVLSRILALPPRTPGTYRANKPTGDIEIACRSDGGC